MTATRAEAIDQMLALFKTVWDTTPHADRVKYPNVGETDVVPDGVNPWVRVNLRHVQGKQVTLSGPVGTRRFRRFGILICQLFEPVGEGLTREDSDYAELIRDAYEGVTTTNGVIFRNVRINEIGSDGSFFQTNIIAEFEYDEVK